MGSIHFSDFEDVQWDISGETATVCEVEVDTDTVLTALIDAEGEEDLRELLKEAGIEYTVPDTDTPLLADLRTALDDSFATNTDLFETAVKVLAKHLRKDGEQYIADINRLRALEKAVTTALGLVTQ